MKIEQITKLIDNYKNQNITSQSWRKDNTAYYNNNYIKLESIESSNRAGGIHVKFGKQWSLIIEIKKDFTNLENWKLLKNYYKDELKITKVSPHGRYNNCYGIRFYKMTSDPTNEIVINILDYIFSIN